MRRSCILLLCMLLPLLGGCYDTLNVDDQSYPVAIGIDIGTDKNYTVSLHIPVQKKSDSGAENTSEIVEAQADNLYEIKSKLDSVNPWILNFSHLSYLIVSEEIAQSGMLPQLIADAEEAFLLKKSVELIVANGKAGKFMEGLNDETLTPDQVLDDLFTQQMASGTLLRTNVNSFLEGVSTGQIDMPIALGTYTYKNESIASKLEGSTLFSGSTMVGVLTPEETQLLLIGTGKFRSGNFSPDRFDSNTSFRLEQMRKPVIEFDPHTHVRVYLRCELYSYGGTTEDIDYNEAEKVIGDHIAKALDDLFAFCTRLDSDPLGLGRLAVQKYRTQEQWENSEYKQGNRAESISFSVSLKWEGRE